MRRTQAVTSDVVEGRHQARLRAQHRERLRTAGPVVPSASDAPARYAHLDPATKAVPREARVRERDIKRTNGLLVDSMCRILARPPKPNHDPVLLSKARHATVEDAYRPGPIPLPKSLNKEARTRQLEQIVLENERFLSRLIASPGVYRRERWAKKSSQELQYLNLHCKFPYSDPSAAMPALNPMLAIANAQSNRAAEVVLRNQQAQLALLQQQQQQLWQQQQQQHPQLLPPMPGATPLGDTTSFGSTFGSTAGSSVLLPPMGGAPSSASSGVPNHFPLPPHAALQLIPSPPSTAGSMQPRKPLAPLSARSAVAPSSPQQQQQGGGIKLRAQYTAQGVRILRAGRKPHPHHSSASGAHTARPVTSASANSATSTSASAAGPGGAVAADPLRLHMGSRTRNATTFQPLRTQQALALQQQQQKQQQRQAEEQKEDKQDTASSGDATAAAATEPTPSSTSAAAVAPGGVVPLFEDTLVISNRPVLVRVGQRAGAAAPAPSASASASAASSSSSAAPSPSSSSSVGDALEICVFDPYTSLEYALSLPFTFVRMCFYQVPDLLLPNNRNFLVQTLLHYLVFAPAAGPTTAPDGSTLGAPESHHPQSQGLELLVDIVPPPPRSAAEAAAWARVQEAAALEQAQWELANEKEAARARREATTTGGGAAGSDTTMLGESATASAEQSATASPLAADEQEVKEQQQQQQQQQESEVASASSSNEAGGMGDDTVSAPSADSGAAAAASAEPSPAGDAGDAAPGAAAAEPDAATAVTEQL